MCLWVHLSGKRATASFSSSRVVNQKVLRISAGLLLTPLRDETRPFGAFMGAFLCTHRFESSQRFFEGGTPIFPMKKRGHGEQFGRVPNQCQTYRAPIPGQRASRAPGGQRESEPGRTAGPRLAGSHPRSARGYGTLQSCRPREIVLRLPGPDAPGRGAPPHTGPAPPRRGPSRLTVPSVPRSPSVISGHDRDFLTSPLLSLGRRPRHRHPPLRRPLPLPPAGRAGASGATGWARWRPSGS